MTKQSAPMARLGFLLLSFELAAATAHATERGTLRGQTLSRAGEPIPAVEVLVLGAEEVTTVSGTDGRFDVSISAGTYTVEARSPGFTVETLEEVRVAGGEVAELIFRLTPSPTPVDEIVVTSTFSLLREEPVASVALDREQIMELPHFGDDLYRAVAVLPGTSEGDFSAGFNVRGGFHDEVMVRLDGLELYEPFHLKDFQGVFSILDPVVIGGVDLTPAAFPVEFGDRMSAVVDMTTVRSVERRTSFGISFSNAWAGSSGVFADGKGQWIASGRRGYLDVVLNFVEQDDDGEQVDPRYWDAFAKVDYDFSRRNNVSAKLLYADDTLDFEEEDFQELTDVETSYGNRYLWLGHQAILGPRMFVDSVVFFGRIDADRDALGLEPEEEITIQDVRDVEVYGVRQDWNLQGSDRHYLKWGFEARRFEARYDYHNELLLEDPIDDPRFGAGFRTTSFAKTFTSEHYALYAADRMRLANRLTAEIGARYDEQTLTDDSHLSPRVNLVYDLGGPGLVRLGWGHFFQSHRPHELDVQFGETDFQPAERAEHWALGYETMLPGRLRLRADAYRRHVTDPHYRFETLFDPFEPLPEAEVDLVRIAPERVTAEGVELYLGNGMGKRANWWLSYALSSIDERVDGADQNRYIDQTHAVTASVSYRPSRKWNLNAVWTYHTGWPTTELSARGVFHPEDGTTEILYDVGPFYAERLPDYHRLDVRASRTTDLQKGRLTLFVDIQNIYDRDNLRGISIDDPSIVWNPPGPMQVTFPQESWFGVMPSFGISWER